MIYPRVALACCLCLLAGGCGSKGKDDASGSATAPPPGGKVLVRDPMNDATGSKSTSRDVDVRALTLRREGDVLFMTLMFWRTPRRDMSVRMEFEEAGARSEIRLVRTGGGSLAIRNESGADLSGGRIDAKQQVINAQMPLDAVTSKRAFGFAAVAKSFNGKSVDVAPDKPATFPSGQARE